MTDLEFIERYGSVPLTFHSFADYRFTFIGTAPDGTRVTASVGGDQWR